MCTGICTMSHSLRVQHLGFERGQVLWQWAVMGQRLSLDWALREVITTG